MKFEYNNNTYELIILHVSGSRLYGNSTETSDWDYRGIFIADPKTKLGLLGKVEQIEGIDVHDALVKAGLDIVKTDDIVLYEINRFVELAIDNNPNIMDTLCHNESASVYRSTKGKYFLSNSNLFISTKLKYTFSGYAISQLNRIKSHNKWINEFPETDKVLAILKKEYEEKIIDYIWLSTNFGGKVAEKVTGENPSDNKKSEAKEYTWDEFYLKHSTKVVDLNKYRIPHIYSYCKALDLKAKILDKDEKVWIVIPNPGSVECKIIKDSIKKLLFDTGSFRTLGDSMVALYTHGTGIFGINSNIKPNDPKEVGEFVCLIRINQHEYKKDKDHVNGMWEWKTKRNEARGSLEEQFGYDTKHASHLVRLMLGAKSILSTHKYIPELKGDNLELVKEVRAGKYSYDWILNFANEIEKTLDKEYLTSTLQKKPDIKKINEVLLKVQDDSCVF